MPIETNLTKINKCAEHSSLLKMLYTKETFIIKVYYFDNSVKTVI